MTAQPLTVEGLTATELAERFGTPLYVISEAALRERYRRTLKAVRDVYPRAAVYYAVKSNPILAVRKVMADEGAGGDVFSPGELEISLRAGVPAERLVANGHAKGEAILSPAIRHGVTITLDNPEELELVRRLARTTSTPARVFIRLKLPLETVAAEGEAGARIADRVLRTIWGFTEEEAGVALLEAMAAPELELRGYHHHIGYFVGETRYHADTMRDLAAAIARLRDAHGFTPSVVDLGGGWGYAADPESGRADAHEVPGPETYAADQLGALAAAFDAHGLGRPKLLFELGRSLVGESTVLLGRVTWVKEQFGRRFVITDASKHLLLRGPIEGYRYRWVKAGDPAAPVAGPADLFGPTCTDDELAIDEPFPEVERGDLVAALACGAYAQTFGATLNSLPRPAAVMVNGEQADIVVRRETMEDVLGRYELPAWLT